MPAKVEIGDLGRGPFRIGECLIEPSLNRLSRGDTTIQLELKVMDVLVCLAERAGEMVTRFEIIDRVWATEFIADNTLTHAINEIRTALGDDARNPSFIETIYRRGYRLMVPVTVEQRPAGTVAQFPSRARVVGDEETSPYPGLAAFTEADAEFFFGRENEVVQMWRKITSRRLLAVIGPSGVGKSSFLRAGVIPAKPEGWGILVCHPGEAPFAALARALVPEFEGDREAIARLVHLTEPEETVAMVSRWRHEHDQTLLIVDQFEELFTLSPPEVQARFAALLRTIVDQADIHVLLAMRDDFLYRCNAQAALRPIFEDLTPLEQPNRASLCRALVKPAALLGYAFDKDDLVDAMLDEVSDERSALPLLAFAVAGLWDKRDRDRRLLTRAAYDDIGGVGGALARHAEATLRAIGDERRSMVREAFRNLVTAEGTRAVRSFGDLVSVFPAEGRQDATDVIRQLIDARLLTSFEDESHEDDRRQRIEVVHESLLSAWPRLVGWRTQEADSARLRDELRQAARTWDEHGCSDDMLWTGAAYREFASWRERYPGGLSEVEESFAGAMRAHAGRQRRRRRIAAAAIIVLLVAGLAVGGTFWQRSVRDARRAEATKILALGQLEIEEHASAAVAHAIASLELADSPEARRLALDALWRGPTALVVNQDRVTPRPRFSADGRWLVYSVEYASSEVRILRADGSSRTLEEVHDTDRINLVLSPESDVILTWGETWTPAPQHFALWSAPDGRRLGEVRYEGDVRLRGLSWNAGRVLLLIVENDQASVDAVSFNGTRSRLGTVEIDPRSALLAMDEKSGRWLATVEDNEVLVFKIGDSRISEARRLGRHEGTHLSVAFDPLGRFVGTADSGGEIRLWDTTGTSSPTIFDGPSGVRSIDITAGGSLLRAKIVEDDVTTIVIWSVVGEKLKLLRRFADGRDETGNYWQEDLRGGHLARVSWDRKIRLWPFGAPADAEPLTIGTGATGQLWFPVFGHQERWMATPGETGLTLWPLARSYPSVMRHDGVEVDNVVFGPDGTWLASCSVLDEVKIWPLADGVAPAGRTLYENGTPTNIAASPDGKHLLIGTSKSEQGDLLLSLDGSSRKQLLGFKGMTSAVAFSPNGNLAAGAGGRWDKAENLIRIWDVRSGKEAMILEPEADIHEWALQFAGNDLLLSSGADGLRRWALDTRESELLYKGRVSEFSASANGQRVLLVDHDEVGSDSPKSAVFLDLSTGATIRLESHGDRVITVALDATGTIAATGDSDGVIRVGPVSGENPHVLLGHETKVWSLAFDPRKRWIASGANDGTVRLWPMPDLSKPPLHTLPHDQLIAKLKTLTNVRVVRDEDSSTGWKLTHDPFPGWETVPEW